VVINPKTIIGQWVKIYPGVTISRADVRRPLEGSIFGEIVVKDNIVLSPMIRTLRADNVLLAGHWVVVGTNAILLQPSGEVDIWVGVPAELVGQQVGVE